MQNGDAHLSRFVKNKLLLSNTGITLSRYVSNYLGQLSLAIASGKAAVFKIKSYNIIYNKINVLFHFIAAFLLFFILLHMKPDHNGLMSYCVLHLSLIQAQNL